MADVLARHLAQTTGQPVTLVDVPVRGADGAAAQARLTAAALDAVHQLPPARLVISGEQLTMRGDDLLELVLDPAAEPSWPEAVLAAQRIALGGSRGARVRFARTDGAGDIEVFTTRPDTLFGASFVAVSPSHPAARLAGPAQLAAFRAQCDRAAGDPDARVGVPLGLSVRHPLVPERVLPVWLANFVVESYGTGAAGGCPACDQRDLDFARRYGLPVRSIICPPGADPGSVAVRAAAYAGDGTIINSGFLSGLPVVEAIDAAIARLVEVGRGEPAVQYRRRPLVVAELVAAVVAEAAPGGGELRHLDRSWRFTAPFRTAAALVHHPAGATGRRPHALHVTVPEAATRHLLDARILLRALRDGAGPAGEEPWEEIVLVGDVLGPTGQQVPEAPAPPGDALRLAVLADTPPDRDLDWSDKRHPAAVKFVQGAGRLFSASGSAQGVDEVRVARKVARAAASLDSALRRRRTNTAVAAAREIVAGAAESAQSRGLDGAAQALVGSMLYALVPELAARGLAAAGSPATGPPAWPDLPEHAADSGLTELVVQVNGKKRGVVQVARDADEETVLAAVRADGSLDAHLGERPVRKTVVVRNRLVNFVV
ncbi:MAG: hypothetical protein ACJ73E_06770 [Mycobacteriales bacterium]